MARCQAEQALKSNRLFYQVIYNQIDYFIKIYYLNNWLTHISDLLSRSETVTSLLWRSEFFSDRKGQSTRKNSM